MIVHREAIIVSVIPYSDSISLVRDSATLVGSSSLLSISLHVTLDKESQRTWEHTGEEYSVFNIQMTEAISICKLLTKMTCGMDARNRMSNGLMFWN